MRYNYPISSQELNDRLMLSWEKLVRLLGYRADGQLPYSGVYELLNASGEALIESPSGVPTVGVDEIYGGTVTETSFNYYVSVLKYDYIMRKIYQKINYRS